MTAPNSIPPLEIAEIEVGPRLGCIGIASCPGRGMRNSAKMKADRNPRDDMQHIWRWGGVAILSVVESDELGWLQVPHIGWAAEDWRLKWFLVPVNDRGVPDAAGEEQWAKHGPFVRAMLKEGKNVLVHSPAGRGLSGMMAARLLVELGWSTESAISEVRRATQGALQTPAQKAVVRAAEAARVSAERAAEEAASKETAAQPGVGPATRASLPACFSYLDTKFDIPPLKLSADPPEFDIPSLKPSADPPEFDIPLLKHPYIRHRERLPFRAGCRLLSHVAEALLRRLNERKEYDPTHLEEKLGLTDSELSRFRYIFAFDRGYRFKQRLNAMDIPDESVQCFSVVSTAPRRDFTDVSPIVGVRGKADLECLAEQSPLFQKLEVLSCSQNPDETWAYFFNRE